MADFSQEELRFMKEHGIFLGIREAAQKKRDRLLDGMDRVYGIVGVDRKNSGKVAALVRAAVRNGYDHVRLELCGKGRWTAAELEALRASLRGLGEELIKSVLGGRGFYLLNLEELLDAGEGCRIFSGMLTADAKGNYLLAPPQWRYDGRGVKLGHADTGIKDYQGCVYEAGSAKCLACEKKNFGLLSKLYDGGATAEFTAGIARIFESVRYLGKTKPAFKAYLARMRKDSERESGLFINEGARK